MKELFLEYGVRVIDLRKKARKGLLTQLEYSNFLDVWYNIILSDMQRKTSLVDLIAYLKTGSILNGVHPVHLALATRPNVSEKSIGKYYIVLFKFICSLPPYESRQKYVANILAARLKKNGHEVVFEEKGKGVARAQLYRNIVTFFL